MRYELIVFTLLASTIGQGVQAYDFSARLSMLGMTAQAEEGDLGYQAGDSSLLTADQQGLRLMLDGAGEHGAWSAHLRSARTHSHGFAVQQPHSSALFRYDMLDGTIVEDSDAGSTTLVHYEVDRLYFNRHFSNYGVSFGRQAVDWGSGRFWQPLNLFGSFSPTELDTDYKPGIDAIVADYYPSTLSALSAIYAFAPQNQSIINDSAALHYRRQVGEQSELALVGANIIGNPVIGGAFESVWGEVGWRLEGIYARPEEGNESVVYWITGLDYQFSNQTLLSVEYYDNSRGATSEMELATSATDPLVVSGLQLHLSRRLLAIGLSRELGPLLQGGYTVLSSAVKDSNDSLAWSFLHQFNLTYSVSNESDLLLSLVVPTGRGLSPTSEPRTEFGHLPMNLTLRWRLYL